MKTQIIDKVWRILFILVFVLGTVWIPGTRVSAQPNMNSSARLSDIEVQSHEWSQRPRGEIANSMDETMHSDSLPGRKQPEEATAFSGETRRVSMPALNRPEPEYAQSTGPVPPAKALGLDSLNYKAGASATIINNVPKYLWKHGCGPTAAGMVIGYWDAHGYDWLISGSAATQTLQVNEAIASESGAQNHYSDYVLPLDNTSTGLLTDLSELPVGDEHPSNSLADFMHTSFSYDGNFYGWSWFSDVSSALLGYVDVVDPGGHLGYASNYYYSNGTFNWNLFKAEIDAGRPMVLLVDSDGDGSTDHFIPAFGYDDSSGVQKYAAYNTWDENLHWYDFRPITAGYPWGIYGGVSLSIGSYSGPAAPSDLVVADATSDSITISWQDNSDNEDGFNIYRWGYDGSQWAFLYLDTVDADVTSYTQTSLACGDSFNYYDVSAVNASDESPHTSWVQGVTDNCPPTPTFAARLTENEIHGYEWPLGASETLTIDDPDTGPGVDYTDTKTVIVADWDPNQTFAQFRLWEDDFELQPDQFVTLTDGATTKSHTVRHLTVEAVDAETNTISGTAEGGSLVEVGPIYCNETGCHGFRRVYAEDNGEWLADFDHVGEDDDEQDLIDIVAGTGSEARQSDADWDTTNVQWRALNPTFAARLTQNAVEAWSWAAGISLTLTIDNDTNPDNGLLYTDLCNTDGNGDCYYELSGYELSVGDYVTVSGGGYTKGTQVANLAVTSVDIENDIISGTAGPGIDQISVRVWSSPMEMEREAVVVDGNWSVDFSVATPDFEAYNLVPGDNGAARWWDGDGDMTSDYWRVPNPSFDVWYKEGNINAYDWPLDTLLTLDIEDPGTPESPDFSTTTTVGIAPWDPGLSLGEFHLNGAFNIEPGMILTVSGATVSRELVVIDLNIASIDPSTDIITGTAAPDQMLWIMWDNNPSGHRNFQAEGSGNWTVNYSQPGLHGEPIQDIQPGSGGNINAMDEDGDNTSVSWRVPRPYFEARTNVEQVEGFEWEFGTTLTLEIDDPATLLNPDHRTSGVVDGYTDWDPNLTYTVFWFGDVYDLKPGDEVTLSDGTITKQQVVTSLEITGIDPETDIVTGDAEASSPINVWACGDEGCPQREEMTNEFDHWSSDFSDPSQPTFNIQVGTWVDSGQWDEDGDGTLFGLNAEAPQCQPGDTVTGTVFEHDGITPVSLAYIQIDDYNTGGIRFTSHADQDGQFGCHLPEGDYRIMAGTDNGTYTLEYYNEAADVNATPLHVTTGTQFADINFTISPMPMIEHFTFNLQTPLLQDLAVRQAIALGTDRQRILHEAFLPNGSYGVVSNSMVVPEHWASAPASALNLYPFDPAEARTLLEAAGWIDRDSDGFRENTEDVELAFTFKTRDAAFRRASGAIFQENMESIGIRIQSEYFSNWGFLENKDYEIGEVAWYACTDNEPCLSEFVTGLPSNYGSYSSAAYETALANARTAVGDSGKLPYLIEAQTMLSQDLPVLPLFTRYNVTPVTTPAGSNIIVSPESYVSIRFAEVTQEGVTTAIVTGMNPADLPANLQLLGQVHDIGTNAEFTTAQACFTYDAAGLSSAQEAAIRLFHLDGGTWAKTTDAGYPDTINNRVCGTVSSLSPFAIMYREISSLADFDGDGDTDISYFRPSTGRWYMVGKPSVAFGASGDIPVPADYDGDGDTDIAYFRPSTGRWNVLGQAPVAFGASGDIPVPGDYDGDGDADIAYYRPSNGRWYVLGQSSVAFGVGGAIPVPRDYDGDGDTDLAYFLPSNNRWYVLGKPSVAFGASGAIPVPADYDGDGDADLTYFLPSNNRWYVLGKPSVAYGASGILPVPGDYDGDGDTDIAYFRPSTGRWYVLGNASVAYGTGGDFPLPVRDTNGDGDPYQ